jgi:hypothetical protein
MMRFFLAALLLPGLAGAAILPDAIGAYHRASTGRPALADTALWNEYGLKNSENAVYRNGDSRFTATVHQLQDSTGAMAAFQWQRPEKATPSKAAVLAAETPDSLLLVRGNYLLSFDGYKPSAQELDALVLSLRNLDTTSLPTLPGFLPSQNLNPNSERYITGTVSLQKFLPAIPPSVAAFRMGAEAAAAAYHGAKGDMILAVFNYPTPQIAMQAAPAFEKLPGFLVKRSGPLVAAVLPSPDPDGAERLLGEVRYQAEVTRDEYVPTRRDNIGDMILNVFVLIGILLGFALLSGLALGGSRVVMRYMRKGEEPEAMIALHLERR